MLEIVSYRFPDGDTILVPFVDGREVTDVRWTEVDPGRGWTLAAWEEARQDALAGASPAAAAKVADFYEAARQQYLGEFIQPEVTR